MRRRLRLAIWYAILAGAAYLFMRLGEFYATGLTPSSPSINAFLFLAGLGGAMVLLSPAQTPHLRIRLRY